MADPISHPIEDLIHARHEDGDPRADPKRPELEADIVIVGSGYGASVAAMELAGLVKDEEGGADVSVVVLERGDEHPVGSFPNALGELPGHVRVRRPTDTHPTGYAQALFDLRVGEDIDVLTGNGLGGGSLINANVALEPDRTMFESWPEAYRGDGLNDAFEKIRGLLGANQMAEPGKPKILAFENLAGELEKNRAGQEAKQELEKRSERIRRRHPGGENPQPTSTDFELADLTVNHTEDKKNTVGLTQPPCTNCGNCITGCNVGAKNTLMMNMIPLAKKRGARFYTGANVIRVVESDAVGKGHSWRVEFQRTHSIDTPLERERFHLRARYVILAAGTLGSTEILMRSAADAPRLALSPRLGQQFSTNGDGLAFSYGQGERVDAIGSRDIWATKKGPGPTISVLRREALEGGVPCTLEDAVVPAAIMKVFGEAIITGAQLNRLADNQLPRFFDERPRDPLAFDPEVLRHGQVMLMMTDDGASRSLAFSEPPGALDSTHRSVYPRATPPSLRDEADAGLLEMDARLTKENLGEGFDGGQFVPNPLFRLLPEGASSALGGELPGRRNVSVHPLGGCPMGENADTGVVDPDGRVFDADGGVHAGLLVMDGSILPGAVAANPFLTISAVALRCTETLREDLLRDKKWSTPDTRPGTIDDDAKHIFPKRPPTQLDEEEGRAKPVAASDEPATRLIVREKLLGRFNGDAPSGIEDVLPGASRLFGQDGIIIQLETDALDVHQHFAADRPAERGSERDADDEPVRIHGSASLYAGGPERPSQSEDDFAGSSGKARKLLDGSVVMTIFALDSPTRLFSWRTASALLTFLRRRGGVRALVVAGLHKVFDPIMPKQLRRPAKPRSNMPWWKTAWKFIKTGHMHGRYRRFSYELTFEGGENNVRIVMKGAKQVRFALKAERLWQSLLRLPIGDVSITSRGTSGAKRTIACTGELRVDPSYLFDEGLIQVDGDPQHPHDLVESVMTTVSFIAFFARCIFETNFWELAAPDYPDKRVEQALDVPRLRVPSRSPLAPQRHELRVPVGARHAPDSPNELVLDLHRYPQTNPDAPVVLLIHGLAQGSGVFTSPHMKHNMADHFYQEGHDVWVLDHRLSNRFDEARVPYGDWAIDAIGRYDVPLAVKKVHEIINASRLDDEPRRRVRVFAHCVGAIALQMAILEGRMTTERTTSNGDTRREELLESVCFNAIHPWVVPSPANLARAKLGHFVGARFPQTLLDPILQPKGEVSAPQTLFDRLAFGIARIGEGCDGDRGHWLPVRDHHGTCDRMTLLYGRMWQHANLERAVKKNWKDLVGRAPDEVYQQLFYMLDRERILDDDGENRYLTEANIAANWHVPTLFIHGELSDVFNPQSATRSAVRLDRLLRSTHDDPPKVRLLRIGNFGHMDPILGKRARGFSYDRIHHFFEVIAETRPEHPQAFDEFTAEQDPDWIRASEPKMARAIRAAWIDRNEREIVVRSWVERFRFSTSPPSSVKIHRGDGIAAYTSDGRGDGDFFHVADDPLKPRGEELWYAMVDERTQPDGGWEARRVVSSTPDDIYDDGSWHLVASSIANRLRDHGWQFGSAPKSALSRQRSGASSASAWYSEDDDMNPVTLSTPQKSTAETPLEASPHYYRRLAQRLEAGPGSELGEFDFVVGSCRYPGTPFEAELSDRVFDGMLQVIENEPLDMAFFVGDQIYADAYNDLFDGANWRERYHGRYRAAFGSPAMHEVLGALPVHFAIDDHELVDDWSGNDARVAPKEAFGQRWHRPSYGRMSDEQVEFALKAAHLNMGAGRDVRPVGVAPGLAASKLWYALDHRDGAEVEFPCFVLDTRGERELRDLRRYEHNLDRPQMMSRAQMEAFGGWLKDAQHDAGSKPKFVFAGQVIAPIQRELVENPSRFRRHDGFAGYPDTLREIIELIVGEGIENVVFVGGDHHLSSVAKLELSVGEKKRTAWQIVASGLYAPMPFSNARPDQFEWATSQEMNLMSGGNVGLRFEGQWLTDSRSHFVKVAVKRDPTDASADPDWLVTLEARDAAGRSIATGDRSFDRSGDGMRLRFGSTTEGTSA